MKWRFEPKPEPASQGVACCDVVNRGAAFADGRIYFNTLDGHTFAIDAETGQPVWNTKVGNINIGETITMAPLVVKGKVLVGNSGGEFGVRGWVKALDAKDGHVVWTAYGTGPDRDVLIGPDFKPFYATDKGTDLGVTSWPPDAWQIGGGTMWGWISYDPELNLIYHGTGNPGPWNPDLRPGDNKWTAGIFARDPDTGAARWFYQWSPHDLHDYDGINEQVLLDMSWNGQPRKVLVRPERNGYLYVLDRTTGEVLSAEPFGAVNSTKGVDLKTGRPIPNPDKEPGTGKVVRNICPTASGAKDWQPSAFSPRTGLLYIPHNNLCMDEEGVEVNYIAGTPYVGMNVRMIPGPGGHRGAFTAWDIAKARTRLEAGRGIPGLERRRGDGRRRRLLRNHGGLVQGHQRPDRRAALAVQDVVGDHRPADHLSRAGRAPICGDPVGRGRLGGRCRLGRSRPARRHGSAGLRQRHEGSQGRHHAGGHALCVPPAVALGAACRPVGAGPAGSARRRGAGTAGLRRSQQPALLQRARAKASRTGS